MALPSAPVPCPARILVVGGGGRENALGWALARCPGVEAVWVTPGNGGTPAIAGCRQLAIAESDPGALAALCAREAIALVVVGPEVPLAAGLADHLRQAGVAVFGPGADGAQLEASKQWAKALMREAGVPTAGHWPADHLEDALAVLQEQGRPLVVKADGLAAGKGVTVATTVAETEAAIREVFEGRFGAASLVLEERLEGPEVSVFALTDGRATVLLPPAQDHKRIGEGDTGPNTGGMGAFSPTPKATDELLRVVQRDVLVPTVDALKRMDIPFRGVLYAGLMLTPAGPKVLEFNTRFGDPETQPIMARLKGDLVELCWATATGQLSEVDLTFDTRAACCVVVCSKGYPGTYPKGLEITGLDEAKAVERGPGEDVMIFHAGTTRKGGKIVTNGGRVLGVTALAETVERASALASEAASKIRFEGAFYRRDIGRSLARV